MAAAAAADAPRAHDSVLVTLDLESSTFGPVRARILQIAASAVLHTEETRRQHALGTFAHYARPDVDLDGVTRLVGVVPIAEGARAVHRIENATIAAAPPLTAVLRRFANWLHTLCDPARADTLGEPSLKVTAVVLVAHNGDAFDFPLLFSELERAQIHPLALVPAGVHLFFADTLVAWRQSPPTWLRDGEFVCPGTGKGERTLGVLHQSVFGEQIADAHNALADVCALERLLTDVRQDGALRSPHPLSVALHAARSLAAQIEKYEARADRTKARLARLVIDPEHVYAPCYEYPRLAQRLHDTARRLESIRGVPRRGVSSEKRRDDAQSEGERPEGTRKRARVDEPALAASPYFA